MDTLLHGTSHIYIYSLFMYTSTNQLISCESYKVCLNMYMKESTEAKAVVH